MNDCVGDNLRSIDDSLETRGRCCAGNKGASLGAKITRCRRNIVCCLELGERRLRCGTEIVRWYQRSTSRSRNATEGETMGLQKLIERTEKIFQTPIFGVNLTAPQFGQSRWRIWRIAKTNAHHASLRGSRIASASFSASHPPARRRDNAEINKAGAAPTGRDQRKPVGGNSAALFLAPSTRVLSDTRRIELGALSRFRYWNTRSLTESPKSAKNHKLALAGAEFHSEQISSGRGPRKCGPF